MHRVLQQRFDTLFCYRFLLFLSLCSFLLSRNSSFFTSLSHVLHVSTAFIDVCFFPMCRPNKHESSCYSGFKGQHGVLALAAAGIDGMILSLLMDRFWVRRTTKVCALRNSCHSLTPVLSIRAVSSQGLVLFSILWATACMLIEVGCCMVWFCTAFCQQFSNCIAMCLPSFSLIFHVFVRIHFR